MKKLILLLAVVAVFGFTSCSGDDDGGKSCGQLASDITAAAQAYAETQSEANCNTYKAALQAYVDKDCPESSQYQTLITALGDCSQG